MTTNLPLKFQRPLSSPVWNIRVSADQQEMALEMRNPRHKVMYVGVLGYDSRFECLPQTFDWWHSVCGITQDLLIVERIDDPQDPEAKTLRVFYRQGVESILDLPKSQFLGLNQKYLYVRLRNGDELKDLCVHLATGSLRDLSGFDHVAPSWQLPQTFEEQNEDFQRISDFLIREIQVHPKMQIDFYEVGDYIILGYYVAESQGFSNFIGVWNVEGENMLFDKLDKGVTKVAPASFFVWHDLLIFVNEKVTIKGYKLR